MQKPSTSATVGNLRLDTSRNPPVLSQCEEELTNKLRKSQCFGVEEEMKDDDVGRSQATFRFHVPNLKNLKDFALSPPCYVRNMQWKMKVRPYHLEQNKYLGVFVECNNNTESTNWACHASAEMTLLSHKPDKQPVKKSIQHIFYSKANDWGYTEFISWCVVLNPSEGFLQDGGITLETHLTAEPPYGISWGSNNNTVALALSACDFRVLLDDPAFADITIVTFDGERRAAHKTVLVARSKVFHAMFRNSMSEQNTSELRMNDITGEILEDFLQFLYLGYISNKSICDPEAMFMLSDKYELPALKLLTQEYLHRELSLGNAAHTLMLAIQAEANILKMFTLIFIQEQGVAEVMKSDGWKKLDDEEMFKNSAAILEFIFITSKLHRSGAS